MTNFYSYLNKTGAYREILYVPGGTKVVVRMLAQPKGGGNGVGGGVEGWAGAGDMVSQKIMKFILESRTLQ